MIFSSNFQMTTVSGASSLGLIFGFELGLVAGVSQIPEIQKIDASAGDSMPHAGLMAVVSVPFGITGELMLIPGISIGDGELSNTGIGLKWTLTNTLLSIPMVDVALRYQMTDTKFEYKQDVSGTQTTVEFSDKITSLQVLVGLTTLPIVKPYIGLGTVSADGEFNVQGSNTIFNFTASTTASKKLSDSIMLLGVEVNLLFFKLGLEYSSLFGSDRFTGKLALSF